MENVNMSCSQATRVSRPGNPQRRVHPRSEVDHAVVVVFHGKRFSNCRIRNFSLGGLFLQCSDGDFGTTNRAHKDHALLEIPLTGGAGKSTISLGVKIVFLSGSGMGVQFFKPQTQLIEYLKDICQRGASANVKAISCGANQAQLEREKSPQIISRLEQIGRKFIQRELPGFFTLASQMLLEETDKALSGNQQVDILHGVSALEENKRSIGGSLISQLADHLRNPTPAEQENQPAEQQTSDQEMELIDTEDFNEWIAIVGIARALDHKYEDDLERLNRMLGPCLNIPPDNESNPFSPYSMLWLLQKPLQPLEITTSVKRIVYNAYRDSLLDNANELYPELLEYLEQQGITAAQPDKTDERGQIVDGAPKPKRERSKKTVIETLSSLLAFGRGCSKGEAVTEVGGTAARADVIRHLEHMPSSKGRSVSAHIERQIARQQDSGGATAIDGETKASIGAAEQLINALQQDRYLGRNLQGLVDQMEIPLIKEAINDPTLLNNSQHPVRKLLQAIDRLAPYSNAGARGSGEESDLYHALQQIGSACADGEISDIAQITEQIESLFHQQKETFERNLSLVVSSSEQEHALQQHGETVRRFLSEKLAGRSISRVLDRLLQLGWPALLLQTPAASGEWKTFVGVIDFMISSFASDRIPEPMAQDKVENIQRILRNGFSAYPLHPAETAELSLQIGHVLAHGGEECLELLQDRVVIDDTYLQDLFQRQVPDEHSPAGETREQPSALDLLRGLNRGDWIAEWTQQQEVRLLNLAWKNPTSSRFVFVDGRGKKVLDCDASTLAEQFRSQKYSQLETGELPLVERAVHQALKHSFGQIKSESEVDQLTGLLNRRAFEQRIEQLLRNSTDDSNHILVLLDIDRFNMINDVCGFEGGDQLLRAITNILGAFLNTEANLARTGDDEFGILMPNCTLEKGYQIAENQRRALERYKFSWQDESAPVTISLGIVALRGDSTTAKLMRHAASACSLAKQSGRNCCRVYQAGEWEFEEQRRLIKSVPVIEEALEKDRIRLHSQLITPLFAGEENDHFEILLRVLDETGRPGSPVDFIRAAECYDRMRSIDRWVVNAFFSWLDANGSQLDEVGGFSLNLSGQSMNDAQMIALLKKKIGAAPIPADRIGIEITETSLLADIGKTNAFIEELKSATGCKFHLDDFGSGYASYAYLKDLSIDVVKIDGIFVKDMLQDKSSRAMVKSIVDISHYMNKKVIAEFAETEAQLIALRELNVDFAQGFAVGHPMPLQNLIQPAAAIA